jgi:hypothetical protein
MSNTNPFIVHSPEDLEASEAHRLFVDVLTDFHKIRDRGHTMLHGPRGCGKSMMFRYLEPDCQKLYLNKPLAELPFFAILVPIKNTTLNVTELDQLKLHQANVILNEHFVTMYVASRTFVTLSKAGVEESAENTEHVAKFAAAILDRLKFAGWKGKSARKFEPQKSVAGYFEALRNLFDDLFVSVVIAVRGITFPSRDQLLYEGPVCGYLDFLVPMYDELRRLSFMPKGPVYLLMDDADYLNLTQTRILNSWLSTRTQAAVSIKVSTQLKYKSYQTTSGMSVDAPHDFSEISVSDRYTSSRGMYLGRVKQIIERRLENSGYPKDPYEFFPFDEEQEREIAAIGETLIEKWHRNEGRGHRPEDDALRYARPTFMQQLKGPRKSLSSYSYSGFEQLVHISSGLVRYFLEPAARMFAEQQAMNQSEVVKQIEPAIQNRIVREEADKLMLAEFEKVLLDEQEDTHDVAVKQMLKSRKLKLYGLIRALGGVFHEKLVSNDAERRVFSVALLDNPDPDVLDIFNLGVQFGYFHRSMIGNKDGTGRTPLYVLTRRLAPHFNLDPSGFAGYLFIGNDRLREAMESPDTFLRKVKQRGIREMFEERQLQLFSTEAERL